MVSVREPSVSGLNLHLPERVTTQVGPTYVAVFSLSLYVI
jgi:hypothetical protein